MEFDFQSAFQPATPPYTDSSGAEFDEAISSLLEQSPQQEGVDMGDTNELQNWLQSQPIFNAYDDPFQSLQAGLSNSNGVSVDPQGLMLADLQSMQSAYPQDTAEAGGPADGAADRPAAQPKSAKRKAADSGQTTKKQKSEAQKQRFPKPPQPVPPPPSHGGPKNPSHNAVERRYRNNINTRILSLRCAVPALVAKPPPQTSSRRKAPPLYVEGVAVPNKINKQTVLIGATDYIRRLRGREQRLMREVELLRSKLPIAEKGLWENEWGAVDDRELYDEVEDFAPPDNAFVDLIDEPDTKTSTSATSDEQQSQQSPSSDGSSAPRYLLGMFLSFGLLQKPYQKQQNIFRRHFEEGTVLSSSLPPIASDEGIHWREHIIPDLYHPRVHDIIQTVLIFLTLVVLLYPLLPKVKSNPIVKGVEIGWMSFQRLLNFKIGGGGTTDEIIKRAQRQIYNPKEYSKLDKMHTYMTLASSQQWKDTPLKAATAALHSISSKLWKSAQTMKGLENEPRYVQLALERDLNDATQLCRIGDSNDDLNVLQKISVNVSILALEELWSLIFTQIVEEKASASDVQLINKAITQLVTSSKDLPVVKTMSTLSAAMWALFQGKTDIALRLSSRVNKGDGSLKCLQVFRMLTNTSDDIEDNEGAVDKRFTRCDDLATIAMLYFSLKVSLQGIKEENDNKQQARSLYGLTLRLRSLLGSLDKEESKLLDNNTFDAAVDCLQVTGYKLMGFEF
ncbi:hypothetical protein E3Q23_02413 [Wallemia mellicola]|uniref:BHLH domain-containing protein n=1 Tax=Wallemia mellicola TaxID=1708541 RepID=A0A4T0LYX5_9BASI|nr:hypothetical protein E3Q23_02413 [Wallemia mellicola]TIC64627.1 hypothetical protein E3Q01_02619 [Wallemia mellicola]